MQKSRVVVAISGATGFMYGVKALQILRELGAETHLVMSKAAGLTREHETTLTRQDVIDMADVRGGAACSDRVPRFLSGTSGAIMLPI